MAVAWPQQIISGFAAAVMPNGAFPLRCKTPLGITAVALNSKISLSNSLHLHIFPIAEMPVLVLLPTFAPYSKAIT